MHRRYTVAVAIILLGFAGLPAVAQAPLAARVEPDVITRGQTTTVVVSGDSLDLLKTLRVTPALGLRVGPITPLEARPDGSQAVSLSIAVAATAQAGDRDLTVLAATKRTAVGRLRINSHAITIVDAVVNRAGAVHRVRVTATDGSGDIRAEDQDVVSMDGALVDIIDPLLLDARCEGEPVDVAPSTALLESVEGSSFVLAMEFDGAKLADRSGCALRVRVRDARGNRSAWTFAELVP